MATSVPIVAGTSDPTPTGAPADAVKPPIGVQISAVEIKPKAVAGVQKKGPKIPPGFKLIQKPKGDGTFSPVLRKMTPEELKAAGQEAASTPPLKPDSVSTPAGPGNKPTAARSITTTAPDAPPPPAKPDAPVAKSDPSSPPGTRTAAVVAGTTAVVTGMVALTEGLAKMAEHGMKVHSVVTGTPLPGAPSPAAAAPPATDASKPAVTVQKGTAGTQARAVVPSNVAVLAVAPGAAVNSVAPPAAGLPVSTLVAPAQDLAALNNAAAVPLTQAQAQAAGTVPKMVGVTAGVLSYYTNPAVSHVAQPGGTANADHAGGSASGDGQVNTQGVDSGNAPEEHSHQQQQDDSPNHQQDGDSSNEHQDGDVQYEHQDGDIPYEHEDGDIEYEHQDGDIPYEHEDGDIPYEEEEGDIPYENEEGDIPYEPEEGDIPYEEEEGDIPYENEEGDIPYEPEEGDIPYEEEQEGDMGQDNDIDGEGAEALGDEDNDVEDDLDDGMDDGVDGDFDQPEHHEAY